MSKKRAISVFFKLLPLILILRKDRRDWVKKEGRNVKTERYRKNARKVLNTFVSLGPVYIKLGQWLSSRADILPQPYMEELAKLQDDVPPAPFEQVKPIIENDLGPIEQNFDYINTNVLSGASLGQVYLAKIKERDVVVKVRRPNIDKIVEEDIKILKKFLPIAMKFIDPNLRFSAEAMLSQFIETIHEEMDYTIESQNLKTIKRNMRDYPRVIIPSVIDDHSTKHVLTLEYIPGIKITNVQALDEAGLDREQLVIKAHKVFFTMLLHHSIFHADPHPGNISVTKDGSLILYDFGMVGRLDSETRLKLIRLYLSLVEKDPPRTVNAMSDLGMLVPGFNRAVLEKGIYMSIQTMHGRKVDDMEVKALMELANKTMSKFPFRLPKHLALYLRMATILEGIYLTHKVNFRFINVLRNILEQENLIRDAYVEELKYSLNNFTKSIDATISIAPKLKEYLEENRSFHDLSRSSTNVLLAGSILSSAVFVGSAVLYATNTLAGQIGMIGSAIIMAISLIVRKR